MSRDSEPLSALSEEARRTPGALARAGRLMEEAAAVGFDWPGPAEVFEKVEEELGELREAWRDGDTIATASELGDLLLAAVNLARVLRVSPEDALHGAADRFVSRFRYVEARLAEAGSRPEDASLARMDALWNEAKRAGVGVAVPVSPAVSPASTPTGSRGR